MIIFPLLFSIFFLCDIKIVLFFLVVWFLYLLWIFQCRMFLYVQTNKTINQFILFLFFSWRPPSGSPLSSCSSWVGSSMGLLPRWLPELPFYHHLENFLCLFCFISCFFDLVSFLSWFNSFFCWSIITSIFLRKNLQVMNFKTCTCKSVLILHSLLTDCLGIDF